MLCSKIGGPVHPSFVQRVGMDFKRSGQEIQDCAIDALPDLAREELPNGPERLFWVKVRDEAGDLVFEATLSLASRWFREPSEVPAEG